MKKLDLVVSFDTTGSMYAALAQVRRNVQELTTEMFKEFDNLELGVVAHGDYCDKDNPYTLKFLEPRKNKAEINKFIGEVQETYGGDTPECYELVLKTANEQLAWRTDAEKILVLIGDAEPHDKNYYLNKDGIDWRKEIEKLKSRGIKVIAVHALANYRQNSKWFYETLAKETGGTYLTLDQFSEVTDIIKAICYSQYGVEKLNEYVEIIKDKNRYTMTIDNNIRRLQGLEVVDTVSKPKRKKSSIKLGDTVSIGGEIDVNEEDLLAVAPGRFQVLEVDKDTAIKEFVETFGAKFKKGRGFYELSKNEKVQQYKELILQEKETGQMFTGEQVRKLLGLSDKTEAGGLTENVKFNNLDNYRVFIQSTSVNRKLIAGTNFLYEVEDFIVEDTKAESVVKTEDIKVDSIEDVKVDSVKNEDTIEKILSEIEEIDLPDISNTETGEDETLEVKDKKSKDAVEVKKASKNSKKTTGKKSDVKKDTKDEALKVTVKVKAGITTSDFRGKLEEIQSVDVNTLEELVELQPIDVEPVVKVTKQDILRDARKELAAKNRAEEAERRKIAQTKLIQSKLVDKLITLTASMDEIEENTFASLAGVIKERNNKSIKSALKNIKDLETKIDRIKLVLADLEGLEK